MRQFPEGKASSDHRFRPMKRGIKCLARRILEVKDTPTRWVQSTAGRVEDQRAHDQDIASRACTDDLRLLAESLDVRWRKPPVAVAAWNHT
jgi:hypothetical protein